MSGNDYSGGVKQDRMNWMKALMPVFGVIFIGAAAAIAWVLSEPLYQYLLNNVAGIPNQPEIQLAVGVVIFLLFIMVFSLVYAALAPKPTKTVKEAELEREKQQKELEAQRAKRRKREMRNKMRSRNREG